MSKHDAIEVSCDAPAVDTVIAQIADYVKHAGAVNIGALESARLCLLDSLGCAFEALGHPDCKRMIRPIVPGITVLNGARVPGTSFVMDPVAAAFSTGTLIRWLDYSDSFFGETVIHPSDTIGAVLALADWLSRSRLAENTKPPLVRDVLHATVKAYEIMGWLALHNNFLPTGLDNTFLGKIAVAAVGTQMLGGSRPTIVSALSNAFIDGHALATFRRAPNTGPRKSWAGADAASRGVWLAFLAANGEAGYATALTTKQWGFYDVLFGGKPFATTQSLGTQIIENVIFKIAYPAALHAQTAVEAALKLHPLVASRTSDIVSVEIWTHQTCMIMIDKKGPLRNFADRDHCLQYMVAVGLIFGSLTADHYQDNVAADPRIDELRSKMIVHEDLTYSREYLMSAKRTNANAICVHFSDGTDTGRVEVTYPLGHPARRKEGIPLLRQKFECNVNRVFSGQKSAAIFDACREGGHLETMPVSDFLDLLTTPQ